MPILKKSKYKNVKSLEENIYSKKNTIENPKWK